MTSRTPAETAPGAGPEATDPRPASFDLARHARDLRAVLLPALVLALVAAALVYVVTAAAPTRYAATVEARTVSTAAPSSSATADTDAAALQAAYTSALTDTPVLDQIARAAGADLTSAEVTRRVSVAAGTPATLLTVTASGDTGEQAAALASATVTTLDAAVAQRRQQDIADTLDQLRSTATTLQFQLDSLPADDVRRAPLQVDLTSTQNALSSTQSSATVRLVALSDPNVPPGPTSPTPVPYALVAFLAVLLLGAEALVVLRGRWGSRTSRARAARLVRSHGATLVDATRAGGALSPELALLVRSRVAGGRDVVLLRGEDLPATPWVSALRAAADVPTPGRGGLVELDADTQWWLGTTVGPTDTVLLAVLRGSRSAATVDATLAGLAAVHADTTLVLLPGDGTTDRPGSSARPVGSGPGPDGAPSPTGATPADRGATPGTDGRHRTGATEPGSTPADTAPADSASTSTPATDDAPAGGTTSTAPRKTTARKATGARTTRTAATKSTSRSTTTRTAAAGATAAKSTPRKTAATRTAATKAVGTRAGTGTDRAATPDAGTVDGAGDEAGSQAGSAAETSELSSSPTRA